MQLVNCQFKELDPIQFPLVNQFYKQVYKKGIARKNEQVFILKEKTILCAAKLKMLEKHILLTGVACEPYYRKQGFASLLIQKILAGQSQPIYCFPYSYLQELYTRLGFVEIEVHRAPEIIRQKYQRYNKNKKLLLMASLQ